MNVRNCFPLSLSAVPILGLPPKFILSCLRTWRAEPVMLTVPIGTLPSALYSFKLGSKVLPSSDVILELHYNFAVHNLASLSVSLWKVSWICNSLSCLSLKRLSLGTVSRSIAGAHCESSQSRFREHFQREHMNNTTVVSLSHSLTLLSVLTLLGRHPERLYTSAYRFSLSLSPHCLVKRSHPGVGTGRANNQPKNFYFSLPEYSFASPPRILRQ